MSASWAHTVRELTADELDRLHLWYDAAAASPWSRHDRVMPCSRICANPVSHEIGYLYVSGRAGRVTSAAKKVCAQHALSFAKKNGVDWPPESAAS